MGTKFIGSIAGLRSWPVKGFEVIRIYYLSNPGHLIVPSWQALGTATIEAGKAGRGIDIARAH
jgi:hypothetical protein